MLTVSLGVRLSPVYPMIVNTVVLSNAVSFFGRDIGLPSCVVLLIQSTYHLTAKNQKFMTSALTYIEETLICAEIVRLLPRFLSP